MKPRPINGKDGLHDDASLNHLSTQKRGTEKQLKAAKKKGNRRPPQTFLGRRKKKKNT